MVRFLHMRFPNNLFYLFVFALTFPSLAHSQYPTKISLTLSEVEKNTLHHSHAVAAAQAQGQAAQHGANVQYSFVMPRLTLEGNWGYATAIPDVQLGALKVPFGTHVNTAIGPELDYTLWDEGSLYHYWKSQLALAHSAQDQVDLQKREVILAARLAYFQAQLALEQTKLLADSLSLSLAQYHDIHTRYRGGTSSKIDALTSHQDVLLRQSEFRQAQADLASSLREIFTLMGTPQSFDLTRPVSISTYKHMPREVKPATAVVELDPPTQEELPLFRSSPDAAHPEIQAFAMQEESSKLAAKADAAQALPKIQLSARSYYTYPDVAVDINPTYLYQNTVGVMASVPLFEAGKSAEKSKQDKEMAEAARQQKEEAYENLERDYLKARDQLAQLKDQNKIDAETTAETSELARLVYSAYKAGHITIVEVQDADLRELEAAIQAARTQAQTSIQIATLDYIAGEKNEK